MSNLKIRQALEVSLNSLVPKLPTAWENKDFSPEAEKPYQEVYFMFAKPENPTMGDGFYRQRGIMQITLRYPQNVGTADAGLRADLLQEHFHRGLSLLAGGVKTTIDETPEIGDGKNIGDRYVINVRVRFYADIFKGV